MNEEMVKAFEQMRDNYNPLTRQEKKEEGNFIPSNEPSDLFNAADDIFTCLDEKPTSWIVDGIVAENSITLYHAEPKTGKTLTALSIALSVALGADKWAGREIKKNCPVIWINSDMSTAGIKRYIPPLVRGILPAAYTDPQNKYALSNQFKLVTRTTWHDMNISTLDLSHTNTKETDGKPNAYQSLVSMVKRINGGNKNTPVLLVLDSYNTLSGVKSEIDPAQNGESFKPLKDLNDMGCAIIYIHHNTKGTETYRGTGAISSNADIRIGLTKDEKTGVLTLNFHEGHCAEYTSLFLRPSFDGDTWRLYAVDSAEAKPSLEQLIIDYVRDNPACKKSDVDKNVAGQKSKKADILSDLIVRGRIKEQSSGKRGGGKVLYLMDESAVKPLF